MEAARSWNHPPLKSHSSKTSAAYFTGRRAKLMAALCPILHARSTYDPRTIQPPQVWFSSPLFRPSESVGSAYDVYSCEWFSLGSVVNSGFMFSLRRYKLITVEFCLRLRLCSIFKAAILFQRGMVGSTLDDFSFEKGAICFTSWPGWWSLVWFDVRICWNSSTDCEYRCGTATSHLHRAYILSLESKFDWFYLFTEK